MQFLMGFARPPANSRASPTWRRVWETGHSLFGRSAIIIGTVNAFLVSKQSNWPLVLNTVAHFSTLQR